MKRTCLVGAVVAGLLIAGVSTSFASTSHAGKKTTKSPTTNLTCSLKLYTQVPAGSVSVTQGAAEGTQFGKAACGKPLGSGVMDDSFDQDSTGTDVGPYQEYFSAGSIYGKYTLTPNDTAPPTTTSFTNASYTGTVTVKNGTGIYKKATGKGTLKCSTTDAAHYSCTEKLKLTLPSS